MQLKTASCMDGLIRSDWVSIFQWAALPDIQVGLSVSESMKKRCCELILTYTALPKWEQFMDMKIKVKSNSWTRK